MKQQKYKFVTIIFLLLGIFLMPSCRKLITDQFPEMEPQPTVNSIVRDGEKISVHVSLSGKLDVMPLSVVENASVQLYVDSVLVEDLAYTEDGIYASSMVAEQEKQYTIRVNIPNFPIVVCETYVPKSELITSIQHINNAGKNSEGLSCPALKITFTNNPAIRQYFDLSINAVGGHSISLINIVEPVILGEGLPLTVFSNRMIKEPTYTMYLEYTTNSATKKDDDWEMKLYPLLIELRSIDASYYHYLRSVYLYERSLYGSSIGEIYPPHQLYSNINDGYGLFTSFSKYVSDTIYPNR